MEENMEEELLQDYAQEEQGSSQKQNQKKPSKALYYALICIFAAVFVLSGIYLGGYFLETGNAEKDYDALASIYQQGIATMPSSSSVPEDTVTTVATQPQETQPPTILPELQPIYELNDDLVGYLNFPYKYLNMQFPVVQTPEESDYYLYRDFYGNDNVSGCPYVPAHCDVFTPSDNIVIYGHNMKTGGMFANLSYYRQQSYWEGHQTFQFDTLYERHTYQIFAVFKTAAKQYTDSGAPWGYPYHRLNNFATEEEFNQFVADVKGAAFNGGGYKGWTFYETGITPQYGDKLLCLSTCEYTMKDPDGTPNGRLVVIAVRVD